MDALLREIEVEIDKRFDCLIEYADYYSEKLFRQSKQPKTLLHKAVNAIEECVYTLISCSEYYPPDLFNKAEELDINAACLLDIITLYAQSNKRYNQEYEQKTFQYIRDYNGIIKVTAKQFPPIIQKGIKRNRETFKSYVKKLHNSISRSKQKVYELALCNHWKYFVTLTINKKHYNRYELETYIKSFSKWLSNYSARKTNGVKIDYILIPEMGRSGAWHLHGIMNGVPFDCLTPFERGKHPRWLINNKYLNWKDYERKFGYCSFGKIRNKEKVAGYITKYIRASSMTQERKLHSRLYYNSKGLKHSTEICRGYDLVPIGSYDFENDYVAIKWLEDR